MNQWHLRALLHRPHGACSCARAPNVTRKKMHATSFHKHYLAKTNGMLDARAVLVCVCVQALWAALL